MRKYVMYCVRGVQMISLCYLSRVGAVGSDIAIQAERCHWNFKIHVILPAALWLWG